MGITLIAQLGVKSRKPIFVLSMWLQIVENITLSIVVKRIAVFVGRGTTVQPPALDGNYARGAI